MIRNVVKDEFKIQDGHPSFGKVWTEPVPASAFAAELIKHTYRAPWSLPDMPLAKQHSKIPISVEAGTILS